MGFWSRLFGHDHADPEAEQRRTAEVHETIVASDATKARADRVIAAYRRFDDDARMAGRRSRDAGERLIDEIEDDG